MNVVKATQGCRSQAGGLPPRLTEACAKWCTSSTWYGTGLPSTARQIVRLHDGPVRHVQIELNVV